MMTCGGVAFIFLLVLCSFAGVIESQYVFGYNVHLSTYDCTGHADGVVEIGCDGYVQCQNQTRIKHICEEHEVFSRNTMSCISISGSQTGCTDNTICVNKTNGRYPDIQNLCQTYYTCHGQIFYGHGYCPSGLKFDQTLQLCNWENNIPPPCGRKAV